MPPRVSIILTTHGEGKYLKQAIGSVLAQTFEDWELLIAVDGNLYAGADFSSDRRISNVRFSQVPDVPCRFAYTINRTVRDCAEGDFVTYLCHDDLYLPWRLDTMVTSFELIPKVDVLFGYQSLVHERDGRIDFMQSSVRIGNPDQPAGTVDHSSVMHRRECFKKAGGWDENAPPRYGDAYFWIRLQNAGYKFHCIPEVLDVHRFNRESITWKEDHPQVVSA